MKIYFCDECHESIPLKDIADNRITIEGGKIYHERCRPSKKSRPVVRGNTATLFLAVVFGILAGSVIMALWGDLIVGGEDAEAMAKRVQRLETELMDLQGAHTRLETEISRDLGESAGIDGSEGKLARVNQSLRNNGEAIQNLSRQFGGLSDGLRTELEARLKELTQFRKEGEDRLKAGLGRIDEQVVPKVDSLGRRVDGMDESLSAIQSRIAELEERGLSGPIATPSEGDEPPAGPTTGEPKLDPEKQARLEKLLKQLESSEGPRRFAAAVDLAEFRGRRVEQAMVGLLSDSADYVRSTALTNLMDMEARWAIPHIIPVLKSEDYVLRETAIAALVKLTGRSIGLEPDAGSAKALAKIRELEKWWEANKEKLLTSP